MKKIDAILAALIGFLDGIFFFFILKNIELDIPYAWFLPIVLALLCGFGMFVASLIGKKLLIILQAAKFFLVGTLNTFIDLVVLNILIWISGITSGIFYSVFKAISFLVATTNSYFWNKYWTFEKKEKSTPREFLKFFMVTTVGLLINVGIASIVVNIIGLQFGLSEKIWSGAVAPIFAAFFAFVWNFLGSKFVVFKK
ncbi:GtrA family protein [Patescibacteria group bacterium]|nr:GtrA family protein [Patescibacteria group bacterium]